MEQKIVQLLTERNLTISTMESCTGGFIISRITNVEGSSKVTNGGYVTYSNEQKIRVGVPAEVIEEHGVYSSATAIAMAETVKGLTNSNLSIGVTGTLSNIDVNNPDSVQGEVYYSIIYEDAIRKWDKITIPVMRRDLQKEFISDVILSDLFSMIH